MKTLVVLFILVPVALAAPALQDEASKRLQDWYVQTHRNVLESVKRGKKSPSELSTNIDLHSSVPKTEMHTDNVVTTQTARSFGMKKPLIVKKKYGYRLYRDSEEEKANADSHESCGRQVKVKLCDEDGKLRAMLRSSGHEISDSSSEDDMKHSIMMAKEAIENLQRDLKKMEQKSATGGFESQPDTDIHEDIEVTRQALEDIHKNFEQLETMNLHATALRDSEPLQDLHIRIANTEQEKRAQWKTAIENIHRNVEIVQNIENSFNVPKSEDTFLSLDAKNRMSESQMNPEIHSVENSNAIKQVHDKISVQQVREDQHNQDDISPSASELVEMKTIDIGNQHTFRSENHKQNEHEKNVEWNGWNGLKDIATEEAANEERHATNVQETVSEYHNEAMKENEKMQVHSQIPKNSEPELNVDTPTDFTEHSQWLFSKSTDPLSDTILNTKDENVVSPIGSTSTTTGLDKHERNIEQRGKDVVGDNMLEDNNIEEITSKTEDKQKEIDNPSLLRDIGDSKKDHTTLAQEIQDISRHDGQTENTMKAADPSDYALKDLHLQHKYHNIDYNESEHTAQLSEMKSAENNFDHPLILSAAMKAADSSLFQPESILSDSHMIPENTPSAGMKTANPSDETPHNIDYNETEHTETLTKTRTAGDHMRPTLSVLKALEAVENDLFDPEPMTSESQLSHEIRPLISLKTADSSDQVSSNDLHLLNKQHNIDDNESEHKDTLTNMRTVEGHVHPDPSILKALGTLEDDLLGAEPMTSASHLSHEIRPLVSLKSADPTNQVSLNDFHLQNKQHQNLDEVESDHKDILPNMRTVEGHIYPTGTVLKTMEAAEDHLFHPDSSESHRTHENRPLISMKMANPSDQVSLEDLHLQNKQHHSLNDVESEHKGTLAHMRTVEGHIHPTGTVLKAMEAVEDHLFHPESMSSESHWNHEDRPLIAMKMANPSNQVSLEDLHSQNKQNPNLDETASEPMDTLTNMRTVEGHIHPSETVLNAMEIAEDHLFHTEPITSESHWAHEKRPMISMKMADPSNQVSLEDLHSQNKQNPNLDETASEPMDTLTNMRSVEGHIHPSETVLNAMEIAEDHLFHTEPITSESHLAHEKRPMISMKMANPSDQISWNDLHVINKQQHNLNDVESEHKNIVTNMRNVEGHIHPSETVLKAMEAVEDHLFHPESISSDSHWTHENKPLISMKMATPSDQVPLKDLHLQNEQHHSLNDVESEPKDTLPNMRTVEGHIHPTGTVLKAMEAAEDHLFHPESMSSESHWTDENRPLISFKTVDPFNQVSLNDGHDELKNKHLSFQTSYENASGNKEKLTNMRTADPSNQISLNDLHLQNKPLNIDYNESEHTVALTELKEADDNVRNQVTLHEVIPTPLNRESNPWSTMKTADLSDQVPLNDPQVDSEIKSAKDHSHQHFVTPTEMKAAENHLQHSESVSSNEQWIQENRPLISMKMANPSEQLASNRLHLMNKHHHHNSDSNEIESAKQIDMNTAANHVHHQSVVSPMMKAAEDHLHHLVSVPSNARWGQDNGHLTSIKAVEDVRKNRDELGVMRNSYQPEYHVNPNKMGHHRDFEISDHTHQHGQFPHRHHHNIMPHLENHDVNSHDSIFPHFHPSLREAMEDVESEHMYRWKPSHESFRSSYGPNPIGSGGAVGVFPNANPGGCGIPLLLSCSPSVVSGSLAKAHPGPYSVPSYRSDDDFSFYNKRDTKKTQEMRNTNVLRSPAIIRQKTRTILDNKM